MNISYWHFMKKNILFKFCLSQPPLLLFFFAIYAHFYTKKKRVFPCENIIMSTKETYFLHMYTIRPTCFSKNITMSYIFEID